jgi:tetratricopeptide (TPR) repeat protein
MSDPIATAPPSRLKRLGAALLARLRVLAEFALIVMIITFSLRGQRSRVVVNPFTKSATWDAQAENADGMNRAFAYELSRLLEKADTYLRGPNLGPTPVVPDIEVPGTGLRLKAVVDYLSEISGETPYVVDAHVVPTADGCTIVLTVRGSALTSPAVRNIRCRDGQIEAGVREAAQEALGVIAPVTLASYCRATKECSPGKWVEYAVHHPPASDDVWAYNLMGTFLNESERNASAAEVMFRAALAIDNGFALGHFNRGVALMALGRRTEALAEYEFAAGKGDVFVKSLALTNLGQISLADQQIENAIARFELAARVDATRAEAFTGWGNALYAQNKLDEAIEKYVIAYALSPLDPLPAVNWGRALEQKGRDEEARRRYEAAHTAVPSSGLANYALALWYDTHNQVEPALQYYRSVVAIPESDVAFVTAAQDRIKILEAKAAS